MPLSPAEVRDVVFSQPPVGELGYHADEVDEFLDVVHAELTRLVENNALRGQVEQLDQQLRPASGGSGRCPGPRWLVETVLTRIRSLIGNQSARDVDDDRQASAAVVGAQGTADQMTAQAQTEAGVSLDQTRAHCAHLISEAQHRAEDMVNKASTQVETMLQEARSTAEAVHRQAREKTASLEEAARTHAETLAVFNHDQSLLERTIDDLRSFEQEYRMQLTLYFQSLLHELDGPTPAAPADPIHTRRDLVSSGLGARCDTGQLPPG
ncbi:MAG: cell division initiation protein [Pseudonocardiales bacterium]|nr:MAG: cell division initiation protein [Pseudonocardiales bacterium]